MVKASGSLRSATGPRWEKSLHSIVVVMTTASGAGSRATPGHNTQRHTRQLQQQKQQLQHSHPASLSKQRHQNQQQRVMPTTLRQRTAMARRRQAVQVAQEEAQGQARKAIGCLAAARIPFVSQASTMPWLCTCHTLASCPLELRLQPQLPSAHLQSQANRPRRLMPWVCLTAL